MNEYIERETVIEALQKCEKMADIYSVKPTLNDFKNAIYNLAPAADVEPVRHGKWRLETNEEEPDPMFKLVVCSNCNLKANYTYFYCPNCGAKMDGGNK